MADVVLPETYPAAQGQLAVQHFLLAFLLPLITHTVRRILLAVAGVAGVAARPTARLLPHRAVVAVAVLVAVVVGSPTIRLAVPEEVLVPLVATGLALMLALVVVLVVVVLAAPPALELVLEAGDEFFPVLAVLAEGATTLAVPVVPPMLAAVPVPIFMLVEAAAVGVLQVLREEAVAVPVARVLAAGGPLYSMETASRG
jgi:hypothetical protein